MAHLPILRNRGTLERRGAALVLFLHSPSSVMDSTVWLGLSLFLVALSLTAVLVAAIPALQEVARAARSAEKLFDTLSRELPPTLDAIRLTGLEITELTDDVTEGVKNASHLARQVDDGVSEMRRRASHAQRTTRSVTAGFKAAWKTFTRPSAPLSRNPLPQHPAETRHPGDRPLLNLGDRSPESPPVPPSPPPIVPPAASAPPRYRSSEPRSSESPFPADSRPPDSRP